MARYEIPKEIKSKPKLMGLEVKELMILLGGIFSVITFLKDMVHGVLVIPFMIVSIGTLLWAVMPSRNNPDTKNYVSIIYFFRRNKYAYHALNHHGFKNKALVDEVGGETNESREQTK